MSHTISRRALAKLTLLVVSTISAVALAEVMLRLFSGWFNEETQQLLRADSRNYGVAHPYIGHLHKPNNAFVISGRDFKALHHTDAHGFRNQWPWPERAEIVIVGDSVAFGLAVADDRAWPAVLARSLPTSRVINLSLIGAGAQQYLRVYETFGATLRPRVVLVGFFASNDFWDAGVFDDWLRSGVGGNYIVWRDQGRGPRVSVNIRHPIVSLETLARSVLSPVLERSHLQKLLRAARWQAADWQLAPPRVFEFGDGRRLQLLSGNFMRNMALAQPDTARVSARPRGASTDSLSRASKRFPHARRPATRQGRCLPAASR